jgi:hypothetical protein
MRPNIQLPLWVKSGNTRAEQMFSAPHPTTDIALTGRHVGFVPSSDIVTVKPSTSR